VARVDYKAIVLGIEAALLAHEELAATTIFKEPTEPPGPEDLPAVLIYLLDRRAPAAQQVIAAGRKTNYNAIFSVISVGLSMDSNFEACCAAWDVASLVDEALMANRTLGGVYPSGRLVLEGGFFSRLSTPMNRGTAFAAMSETRVILDVAASI
jgi:hypothetical protein